MLIWNKTKKLKIKKGPTVIEGLPGIGNVGKVAVEYLIEETDAEPFLELYSNSYPYHVFVNEDDTIDLPKTEFYYSKKLNCILITGDIQSMTPEGHYEIAKEVIDYLKKHDVKKVITLGGFGVQALPKKPKVIGAVTREKLKKEYKKYGVSFESGERIGMIIGASGLFLGFSKLENIDGVCLMTETLSRPMFTDTKGAKTLISILCKVLDIKIDMKEISSRSEELDKAISKAQEIEKKMMEQMKQEDLRYIG